MLHIGCKDRVLAISVMANSDLQDSMIQSISMMSLDGKSTEPLSTAIESTRGCSNRCNCTTLDCDSGAGANAGSKVDTMFVGTGPLSELVWSPQKGLSVKRAACKEKTCILWRPETNKVVVSASTKRVTDNTCQNATTPNISDGARQEMSINFLNSSTGVVHLGISSHGGEPATCDQPENLEAMTGQSSAPVKEGLQCDEEEADMCGSRVGHNYGSMKQIITDRVDDERNLTKRTEEDDFPAKPEADTSTKKVHAVARSLENESKIESDPVPHGFHRLEKCRSTDENDLRSLHGRKGFFLASSSTQFESSAEGKMPLGTDALFSCRIRSYQMKGKRRALSDGIPDGKMSNEGDNSHESVESCNSARSYSAGKKQLNYESSLIGSKRLKRHIQDSPGCFSLVRHDRSFMGWIANMMKGLMSSRESTIPSIALTLVDPEQGCKVPEQRLIVLDKKTGSAGFQTFFDSLYRPKRKAQEILPLNLADQAEEYGAVELDDRVHNVHASLRPCHAETGSFHKLFKLPDSKNNNLPFEGKANQACGSEDGPTISLWITRFAPAVPVPLSGQDACNQTPGEAPTCCTDGMTLKYPIDRFSITNSNTELQHCKYLDPVLPCAQTCGTNHRNTPDFSKEKMCPLDHKVIGPQIKRSEVMVSVLARRLDALKHIVPSDASQDALPEPIHRADLEASSVSRSKLKFKAGNDFGRRLSHSGDYHFQAASALSTFDGNDTWKGKDLNTRQDEAVSSPKSIFDAVKRLQLSRSDVLKWIHSHMPLPCLDGFFLRLRLKKWDAGLGQPRYHVACITGVQKEGILNNPKISTSVDVGGINCQVESRYISNQDFVEDELMAWWTSVSKGGGKLPSEEDLRLKFQEKKLLGL